MVTEPHLCNPLGIPVTAELEAGSVCHSNRWVVCMQATSPS